MRHARGWWQAGRRCSQHLWRWCGHIAVFGLLVIASSAAAQFWTTEVRVTETLAYGQVDWTDGLVLSRDRATSAARRGTGVAAVQAATQAARQGLLRLFEQVRFDAAQMLGQAVRQAEAPRQELEGLVAHAPVVETQYFPGGAVATTVQLPFAGQLTALFLPAVSSGTPDSEPKAEAVHTGVVIDARGLAIAPALFPKIVDERGQTLYAPESVDREAAVQQGYVAYAKAFDQAPAQARIGEHPLVLRALRVAGESRVDLVLSDAEATRIRDYAATRRLVRQCRVLIVM
jgi:hypothetical protein